jgi:hypothetical protein
VPLRSAPSVVEKLPCFALIKFIVGGVAEQTIQLGRVFFVVHQLDDFGGFVL